MRSNFILLACTLLVMGCNAIKNDKKNYIQYRSGKFQQTIDFAIKQQKIQLDFVLRRFKDTLKSQRNFDKLEALENLKMRSAVTVGQVQKIINEVKKYGTKESIDSLMLTNSRAGLANFLERKLDDYHQKYRQKNKPYLSDTTSWSRSYMKSLAPELLKNPPGFGDFYFKGASKEEVILSLSTLVLGILQEALEIHQKIIDEK